MGEVVMNHPDSPLDPREEALVRALAAQAETVRPAGDGLVRIRTRVERRRSRTRWLVPSASAAAVAATVTAVVASGVFTSGKQTSQLGLGPASLTAASTPTVTASPKTKRVAAPTPVPVPVASPTKTARAVPSVTRPSPQAPTSTVSSIIASDYPPPLTGPTPVWPFPDGAAAAAWQKSAAEAWRLDAVATATHFVNGLKLPGVVLGGTSGLVSSGATTTVTLQKVDADNVTFSPFVKVRLSHWGSAPSGPWGVVGVTSASWTVASPAAGTGISGPFKVAVSTPGSTEGQVDASVYLAGAKTPLVHSTVDASGIVPLAPTTTGAGYVVLTNTSGGGATPTVGSLAVVPVQLTASATPVSTYVALVSGKIEVLDAGSGAVVRTLAPGVTGVTSVALTEDGAWVWFATPNGVFKTLARDAKATPTVISALPATYVTVAGQENQSWASTYVSPTGSAQSLTWTALGTTGSVKISDSLPPEAETLAIAPDGKHLASWVRGDSQGTVEVFALPGATDASQGTSPSECTGTIACAGATYAPNGDLILATTDGAHVNVVRDHLGTATPLFSVAASAQTVSLDMDATGTEILLVPKAGSGWLWDGTKATALPAGVSDASW